MIVAHFKAGGRPRTKGSLNAYCLKNARHTVRVEEQVAQSKPWRAKVARACREDQLARHGKLLVYSEPVEVRLVFFFPKVDGVAGATEWPTHKTLGDADKLERNVLDALSAPSPGMGREDLPYVSALIRDDSQVTPLWSAKFWTPEDREPGVQVLVMTAETPLTALEKARERMGGRWL